MESGDREVEDFFKLRRTNKFHRNLRLQVREWGPGEFYICYSHVGGRYCEIRNMLDQPGAPYVIKRLIDDFKIVLREGWLFLPERDGKVLPEEVRNLLETNFPVGNHHKIQTWGILVNMSSEEIYYIGEMYESQGRAPETLDEYLKD